MAGNPFSSFADMKRLAEWSDYSPLLEPSASENSHPPLCRQPACVYVDKSAEWIEYTHLLDPAASKTSKRTRQPTFFYLNLHTGVSQWTQPVGCKIVRYYEPQWWRMHAEDQENDYFYNPHSGERRWSAPNDATHIFDVAAALNLARGIDRPEVRSQKKKNMVANPSAVRLPQRRNARVFFQ